MINFSVIGLSVLQIVFRSSTNLFSISRPFDIWTFGKTVSLLQNDGLSLFLMQNNTLEHNMSLSVVHVYDKTWNLFKRKPCPSQLRKISTRE